MIRISNDHKPPVLINTAIHFGVRSNPRGDEKQWFVFEISLPGGAIEVFLSHEEVGKMLSNQPINVDVSLERSARRLAKIPRTLNIDVLNLPEDVKKEKAWDSDPSRYGRGRFNVEKYPKLKKYVNNWAEGLKIKSVFLYFNYSQTATTLLLREEF